MVVTYRPGRRGGGPGGGNSFRVRRVFVVDNGSDAAALAGLRALPPEKAVEIIANGENLGLATALNQGLARACEREGDFDWALLLDQDSEPMEAMLEGFRAAYIGFFAARTAGADRFAL